MWRGFFVGLVLAGLSLASGGGRPVPGTLLVASEKLGDPNFAEAVVLVIHYDDDEGTLGVILNRPADVTLRKAFPGLHATMDPAYEGGPVAQDAVLALLRTSSPPDGAERVAGDVYAISRKAALEKAIGGQLPPSKFRVYLGYAGWGPGQLENEIREGAWLVTSGAKYAFDANPDSLWERLNREAQSQVARLQLEVAGSFARAKRSAGESCKASARL